MKIPQRTILLSTLVLLHTTGTATVDAFQYPRHAAAAVERRPQPFHKRQASMTGDPATVTGSVMTQGVTPTTYTVITPSPGMKPVAVTKQGQVVPTWAPLYTLCSLEPVASPIANGSAAFSYPAVGKPGATLSPMPIYPIPANMSNGTYPNPSGGNRLGTAPTPLPTANTTMNGTIVPPVSVTDQCRTVYSSTQTTVCATTVTGLATPHPSHQVRPAHHILHPVRLRPERARRHLRRRNPARNRPARRADINHLLGSALAGTLRRQPGARHPEGLLHADTVLPARRYAEHAAIPRR